MPLNNPLVRVMAAILAVAVGIRLVYELLAPVAPYLFAALVLFMLARLVRWYRGRW